MGQSDKMAGDASKLVHMAYREGLARAFTILKQHQFDSPTKDPVFVREALDKILKEMAKEESRIDRED